MCVLCVLCVGCRYVAVIKWLLEWTKVAAAAERPVGVFFWWFADNFSNLLSATILPPPGKDPATKDPRGPSRLWCGNCFLDFLMANWLDFPVLADVGMLILRVVAASLIVHHGLQKTGNPQGFADKVIAAYFPILPFDPLFWTASVCGAPIGARLSSRSRVAVLVGGGRSSLGDRGLLRGSQRRVRSKPLLAVPLRLL